MMKIVSVVGARPQFIKASMVSRAISSCKDIEEQIIHTGQHFDNNMSQIFFDEMSIPRPAVNLSIAGSSHGKMTGEMLPLLEQEFIKRSPDRVLVYGDTNSTLAASLAASKLQIPIVHVEAGLRSFNKKMPEEINRILTDHMSKLLLCPSNIAVKNLSNEGITQGVHNVGDVMYDAALHFGALSKSITLNKYSLKIKAGEYILATVHRAENTDSPSRLANIFEALNQLANEQTVVMPLHPRTNNALKEAGLLHHLKKLTVVPPISFLEMIKLEKNARTIVTDSGGVQKEAYFHGTPCVTVRDETEWLETVETGWNILAGADKVKIIDAVNNSSPGTAIKLYGDGNTAEKIVNILRENLA